MVLLLHNPGNHLSVGEALQLIFTSILSRFVLEPLLWRRSRERKHCCRPEERKVEPDGLTRQ
jgi:hypothetical protein